MSASPDVPGRAALVGRAPELKVLDAAVDGLSARGATVVIAGEPGIGKSTLLRAVEQRGRSLGLTVMTTTGVEAEASMPYAGLHRLLRPALGRVDDLAGPQRGALLSALGLLDGPAPETFLVALAALNLLADLAAEIPLVMTIDDVQWLDEPSESALAFIGRRIENDPIGMVVAVRAGYSTIMSDIEFRRLEPGPLDDDAARALLTAGAADLSQIDRQRVLRAAAGNPLALVELPVALRAQPALGPNANLAEIPLTSRLERAFVGRLASLPAAPTRDVTLVAAVDSSDDLSEILHAAAFLTGGQVPLDAVDAAVAAGLVRVGDARLAFRHPLVRSAALAAEPMSRRHQAHAALARALVREPFRRAWHQAHSIVGPDDAVADELERTHAVPLQRGSVLTAARTMERAAQLTSEPLQRGRRLVLAAEQAYAVGQVDMVQRLLAEASRGPLTVEASARIEFVRELAALGAPGDPARVLEVCRFAGSAIDAGDPALALNLLFGASVRCWTDDPGPDVRSTVVATAGEFRTRIPALGDHPGYAAILAGAEPVRCGAEVATLVARLAPALREDGQALRVLGLAAHGIGHATEATDLLLRSASLFRRDGRLGLLPSVLTSLIANLVELGDWDRAMEVVDESHRIAQDTGQHNFDAETQLRSALVLALRGENESAQALAAQGEQDSRGRHMVRATAVLARGLGWLAVGRHATAYAELRHLFDPDDAAFHLTTRYQGLMFLAEAAVRCGKVDDARAVAEDLEQVAEVTASSILDKHLLYSRCVLADDNAAEEMYVAALNGDLERWPWHRARIELAFGGWLRRHRRVKESRARLASAHSAFEAIGAPSWTEQCRIELRAAGERRAPRQQRRRVDLSPQEAHIARLAAEGMSNREIGAQLYLSPRTVGSHLYRIFPKLDVTSRAQLAARLNLSPAATPSAFR